MPFTPGANATAAVLQSWANTADRSARSAPGRAAALAAWETKVDPDGIMSPADRTKAAENARKAHLLRIAQKGAAARRAKAVPAVPDTGGTA